MVCKYCDFENDSDAHFCENCGAKLATENFTASQTGYPKAPLAKRFTAALLDGFIMFGFFLSTAVVCNLIYSMFNFNGVDTDSLSALLSVIPPVIYTFIKDGLGEGQSWGKKAVGLMVVYLPNGKPCTKVQSAVRAMILGLLSITLIGWVVEPIMVLATSDSRRLADKVANTQVIEKTTFNS
jgi:uncharacterized RDD family membrane protein YckC